MPNIKTPVEIFYAYAHADKNLLKELDTHLSLLKRQGYISSWYDRLLLAGTNWELEIDDHLNRASVILLLISPDFLASNYCYGVEMQRALERDQAKEARVIPILLRPVNWKGAPFAHLQVLPEEARFITLWKNRDAAFASVVTGIRKVIEALSKSSSLPLSQSVRGTAIQQIMVAEDESAIERSEQEIMHGMAHSQEMKTRGKGRIKDAKQKG